MGRDVPIPLSSASRRRVATIMTIGSTVSPPVLALAKRALWRRVVGVGGEDRWHLGRLVEPVTGVSGKTMTGSRAGATGVPGEREYQTAPGERGVSGAMTSNPTLVESSTST